VWGDGTLIPCVLINTGCLAYLSSHTCIISLWLEHTKIAHSNPELYDTILLAMITVC
jgi:hypothetical protein